jgi:hypothetical protein
VDEHFAVLEANGCYPLVDFLRASEVNYASKFFDLSRYLLPETRLSIVAFSAMDEG